MLVSAVATGMVLGAGVTAARAQSFPDTSGQVNISGATLFTDFFRAPASMNDHIDVNRDGFYGWNTSFPYVDLLGRPNWNESHWIVQYRGVGSGNGLRELVTNYAGFAQPVGMPSDRSYINALTFHNGTTMGPVGNPANSDWGYTPVIPNQMDMAVMDVPTPWMVQYAGTANWSRKPGQAGYGTNPALAYGAASQRNVMASLGNLNTDTSNPDSLTVFDTTIAWVPIAFIANRGTGLENVTRTELQHLYVTGRMPNGENLAAATRDPGSGTRNGAMNSIGVDPSWGVGDNTGARARVSTPASLGYTYDTVSGTWMAHQVSNLGGSGTMETAVQNNRLAVGYSGLMGSSRAAADAAQGLYEIVNLMDDVEGGTQYVRPSLDGVISNSDVNSAWRIGGPETFATVGDPMATPINGAYGALTNNPQMSNPAAAAYLRNIVESIAMFTGSIASGDPDYNMPGEYLAVNFTLMAALDYVPGLLDPASFSANSQFNENVKNYTLANNVLNVVDYGTVNPAGLSPKRGSLDRTGNGESDCVIDGVLIPSYSDGSVDGAYTDAFGDRVSGGIRLSARNSIMGDFNNNGTRNFNDAEAMMTALFNPLAFEAGIDHGGPRGDMLRDAVVVEIIGDFNGDGNFDAADVRYFADGLAIDPSTGKLNRYQGFRRVDQQWVILAGESFFADTVIATGKAYQPGDAAFDIAGGQARPGSSPTGHDGRVDARDIDYVYANFGDWSNLDDAAKMDLSCDFTGDLIVDQNDVDKLVRVGLGTEYGDVNLDGRVNSDDLATLLYNWGQTGMGWADGKLTRGEGVNTDDLAVLLGNWGFTAASHPSVPEPGTLAVVAIGTLGLLVRRRR